MQKTKKENFQRGFQVPIDAPHCQWLREAPTTFFIWGVSKDHCKKELLPPWEHEEANGDQFAYLQNYATDESVFFF
jgi:hypothetical protein